jgi:hypothetical protein
MPVSGGVDTTAQEFGCLSTVEAQTLIVTDRSERRLRVCKRSE